MCRARVPKETGIANMPYFGNTHANTTYATAQIQADTTPPVRAWTSVFAEKKKR